jgi:hypothetical protein
MAHKKNGVGRKRIGDDGLKVYQADIDKQGIFQALWGLRLHLMGLSRKDSQNHFWELVGQISAVRMGLTV